jgi:hypothetical protein
MQGMTQKMSTTPHIPLFTFGHKSYFVQPSCLSSGRAQCLAVLIFCVIFNLSQWWEHECIETTSLVNMTEDARDDKMRSVRLEGSTTVQIESTKKRHKKRF